MKHLLHLLFYLCCTLGSCRVCDESFSLYPGFEDVIENTVREMEDIFPSDDISDDITN